MIGKTRFVQTMDPHALNVRRGPDEGGPLLGSIQWHPERSPRFVPAGSDFELAPTLVEMREITSRLEHEVRKDLDRRASR